MKSILIAGVVLLFLGGCASTQPRNIVVDCPKKVCNCKCPTFDRKLHIQIADYDEKYGLISWEDVGKIEKFLKAKHEFNVGVMGLNGK